MPINPYSKYIKQYQTSNITTATPEKLMIMLFDGAIQFLQKAKTYAQKAGDSDLMAQINQKLSELSSQSSTPSTNSKQQPWAYHITGDGEEDYIPVIAA